MGHRKKKKNNTLLQGSRWLALGFVVVEIKGKMVVEKAWALETDKSGLYYMTLDKVFALSEPQFLLMKRL